MYGSNGLVLTLNGLVKDRLWVCSSSREGVDGELYGVFMIACVIAMPPNCLRYLFPLLAPSGFSLGLEHQTMAFLRLLEFLKPLAALSAPVFSLACSRASQAFFGGAAEVVLVG